MIPYLTIAAFAIPVISASMGLLLVNWLAGAFGQWLKAHKEFPTPLAHALMFGIGIAVYASMHHPTATDAEWWSNALAWATSSIGTGSVLANHGVVPKTDTIGG